MLNLVVTDRLLVRMGTLRSRSAVDAAECHWAVLVVMSVTSRQKYIAVMTPVTFTTLPK